MIRAFALIFLLVYFWYWTFHYYELANPSGSKSIDHYNLAHPSGSEPIQFHDFTQHPDGSEPISSKKNLYFHSLRSDATHFSFLVDGISQWTVPLPEEKFFFNGDRFVERDSCHGIADGGKVLASGKVLYDYLRRHDLTTQNNPSFASTATLQRGNVFYFKCRNNQIRKLDMCPSGKIFHDGECRPINECFDRAPGSKFNNPFDISTYYECPGSNSPAVLQKCPSETWFAHDTCRPKTDLEFLCEKREDESSVVVPVDFFTRIVCRDGKAIFEKCPEGEMFFGDVCESNRCVGKPNGTRLPMKPKKRLNFKFSPGYVECKNERIHATVWCPVTWNKFYSNDQLTHELPMVFDGRDCAIPSFCDNVTSEDANTIVPVYDFSKYVRNWRHSRSVDKVTGIVCENGFRKRKRLDPGYEIKGYLPKKSKLDKVFLSERFDAYYDTSTESIVPCDSRNEIFDGRSCRPVILNAFGRENLGMFRLTEEDWIPGWTYSNETVRKCEDPQHVFSKTYNACFHPDCAKYPFLSQLPSPFFIVEGDFACTGSNHHLVVKKQIDDEYDYWSQRKHQIDEGNMRPMCIPGRKIQSGHFMFDSIVYQTCDETQPFVFCPYVETDGIRLVEGKRWACFPKNAEMSILKKNTWKHFEANEVKAIRTIVKDTKITFNDQKYIVLNGEKKWEEDKPLKVRANEDVEIWYRYRQTFPPDVVFKDGLPMLSNIDGGGAFLMKRNAFTSKAVTIPKFKHENIESLSDFL